MENKKMRILIADDNKDFCDCLSNYISKQDDMEIVSIAHDGNEAVTKIITDNPDVALIDGIMPKLDGMVLWRNFMLKVKQNLQCVLCLQPLLERLLHRELSLWE